MKDIKTYSIIQTNQITTGELDFQLYEELFGEETVNQIYEDGVPSDYIIDNSFVDEQFILINELETIIKKLKQTGSNYVSISYNSNHPDYIFTGLKIRVSTESEIIEYNKKLEKTRELNQKRMDLYKQLKDLEKN
jgi:hypothetical protein